MAYTKPARTASPEEIKRFGHVSVFFQRLFKKYPDLTVGDFNEKVLGRPRTDGKVYNWLNSRGALAQDSAAAVGKLFGIDPGFFLARSLKAENEIEIPDAVLPEKVLAKLGSKGITQLALLPAPETPLTAPGFSSELQCKTNGDGSVYISYHGTVTRERAAEIVALLVK